MKTPFPSLELEQFISIKEKAILQSLTPFEICKLTDYLHNRLYGNSMFLVKTKIEEISQVEFVVAVPLLKKGKIQAEEAIKKELAKINNRFSSPKEFVYSFLALFENNFSDSFNQDVCESLYQLCVYQSHYTAKEFSINQKWITNISLTEEEQERLIRRVLGNKLNIETLLTLRLNTAISHFLSQPKNKYLSYQLLKLSFIENTETLKFFDEKVITILEPFYKNILTLIMEGLNRGLGAEIQLNKPYKTKISTKLVSFHQFVDKFLMTAKLSVSDKENCLFMFYSLINHHYTKKFTKERAGILFFNKKIEFFDVKWYKHLFSLLLNKKLPLYFLNHFCSDHQEVIKTALLTFNQEQHILISEEINKLFVMNQQNKANANQILTEDKNRMEFLFNNQHLYYHHKKFLKSTITVNGVEEKKEDLMYYSFLINKPILIYSKEDLLLKEKCFKTYLTIKPYNYNKGYIFDKTFFIKEKQFMVLFIVLERIMEKKELFPPLNEKRLWLKELLDKKDAVKNYREVVYNKFSEIFKRKLF
jgi:hypothetical protein